MTPLPNNQNLISGAAPPGEYASGADKPSVSWLIWDSSPQGLWSKIWSLAERMCLLFIFNIISRVGTELALFRHDSWLRRSFWKMSQGISRGSLVRNPKRVKIKEKQHLDTLEQKSSKKLTGEREFGRVLLRARSGKRGGWKISLRVRVKIAEKWWHPYQITRIYIQLIADLIISYNLTMFVDRDLWRHDPW